MPKKVMIVCGSPRKQGNTNRVAAWVADAARAAGAEVEVVDAPRLKLKTGGCIACMGCKKSDAYRCVIDDEATPILARMPECDALILATPIYWFGPTAQLKAFTDRMFSLVKFTDSGFTTPFTKTRFALIATGGGGSEDGLSLTEQMWKTSAGMVGFPLETLLVPNAPSDPAEIEKDADLKSRAAALGRKLAGA